MQLIPIRFYISIVSNLLELRSLKLFCFKNCFDLCLCGLKHFINSRHSTSNLQSVSRSLDEFFITFLCLYLSAFYPLENNKHSVETYLKKHLDDFICTLQVKNDSVCDKSRQILHEKLSLSLFQISSAVLHMFNLTVTLQGGSIS